MLKRMNPVSNLLVSLASLATLSGLVANSQAEEPLSQTQYRTTAVEILREAVSYRSVEGSGQIRPLASSLADNFLHAGFASTDVHLLELPDDKAALVVRLRGDGSGGKPILLMAHMDVVDALATDWTTDPFVMHEQDGDFYGRGVLDNKSEIAALTTTFMRFKAEGYLPSRDLIILFSGDEETTAATIRTVLTKHRPLVDAEFALNSDGGGGEMDASGKPTKFLLQAAEKSYMSFELTVQSPGGHSSRPALDNAIYTLTNALRKLEQYRFPVNSNDITLGYFAAAAKQETGELREVMQRFADNPQDQSAADKLYANPALVGFTRTTCVPTMLQAGHAENALPQTATATINCRVFPGFSVAETQATLVQLIDDSKVAITVLDDPRSSPASPLAPAVINTLTQVINQRYPGIPVIPTMYSAATDGVETRAAGIPTYGVRGVMHDPDDFRAHGKDEKITVSAFYESLEYWYQLLKAYTAPAAATVPSSPEAKATSKGRSPNK